MGIIIDFTNDSAMSAADWQCIPFVGRCRLAESQCATVSHSMVACANQSLLLAIELVVIGDNSYDGVIIALVTGHSSSAFDALAMFMTSRDYCCP